jgi:hypothetical protein
VAQRNSATKTKRPVRKTARPASRKTKTSSKSTQEACKSTACGAEAVTIDRRRSARRDNDPHDDATSQASVLPTRLERRKKVNRRRQIDPTTCERDYTDDEIQFMNALDDYKRTSGRMFPTCSEVLEVIRSLGYGKLSPSDLATRARVESAEMSLSNSSTPANQ